ncbi:MAG: hypothetical protein N3A68_07870 [Bacteroidia bacterium]|nr:hypothetical protein [Bacteroidia bacterium]GIV22836.1 MAG: hypothetical protein KatS3mg025_0495 [Bacteroidia bacterium]
MHWIKAFLFPATLFAQYLLTGEQGEPYKKVQAHFSILLSPSHLRIQSEGVWDTMKLSLDFLYLPSKIYWLDHKAQISYDVTPEKVDTFPVWGQVVGEEMYLGRKAVKAQFVHGGQRIEVVWDSSVAFAWDPWLGFFPSEGIGIPARYFRRGLPLSMEAYDEKGHVISYFRVKEVQVIAGLRPVITPLYPAKKMGK